MSAPESRSRAAKSRRPDPESATVAALGAARTARASRAGRLSPSRERSRNANVTPGVLRGDMQLTRRADVWALAPETAQIIVETAEAEYSTTLGTVGGAVTFRVPLMDDSKVARLGAWEQVTYYALCELCRSGQRDDDGWLRIPSIRYLGRLILGRTPTGRDVERIVTALGRLAGVTIRERSEHIEIVERGGRQRERRVRVDTTYHLISDLQVTSTADPITAGEPGAPLTPRQVRVRLSQTVMDRLAKDWTTDLPANAVYALGPRKEAALRLYAHIKSFRAAMGWVTARTVEQIVKPAESWSLQKPAKFRAQVEHLVTEITTADPGLRVRLRNGRSEDGGWTLAWSTVPSRQRGR